MRLGLIALCLALLASLICCGGTTSTSTGTVTTTTGTGATTTTGSTSTTAGGTTGFNLAADAGSYSGNFSGSNTQPYTYSGTGTGLIQVDGNCTLTYAATTAGQVQISENRSFTGAISSSGVFTGYTAQAYQGAVEEFPASGTVTQMSSTQIQVVITWNYPYSNGGTFYSSTETWVLTLQ
jgi:hypothetical protein